MIPIARDRLLCLLLCMLLINRVFISCMLLNTRNMLSCMLYITNNMLLITRNMLS